MSLNASPAPSPLEISFPLPKTLYTTLHIHLTFLDTTAMVFLTTTSAGESQGTTKPMGSFVYALPDVGFPPRTSFPTMGYRRSQRLLYETPLVIGEILA